MRLSASRMLSAALTCAGLAWLISEPPGVYPGLHVAGLAVAGLDYRALRRACRQHAITLAETPVAISAGGRTTQVAPSVLGATYDPDRSSARAWLLGREPSLWVRARSRIAGSRGTYIPMLVHVESIRLSQVLRRLEASPRNASAVLVGGRVELIPELPGTEIPVGDAVEAVAQALAAGRQSVVLPVQCRPALVSRRELSGVRSCRAEVTVPITSRHPGARRNAGLAIDAVASTVILPGRTWSMNDSLGPRTQGRGYATAPVLVNEALDLRVGGGICVVSTALFQAAVKANLDVVERHAHSRPVRYARPGTDATLNYPDKDLKVRNSTRTPVVIEAIVQGNQVVVRILGGEN